MSAALVCFAGVFLLSGSMVLCIVNRLIPRQIGFNRRVLLCLVPSGFEEVIAKGVGEMISDREEDGYFTLVHSLYFPSRRWGRAVWSPRQTIWLIPLIGRWLRQMEWRCLYETINGVMLLGLTLLMSPWARRQIDVIRGQDPAIMGVLATWLSILSGRPCCVSIHADHDKRHVLDPERGSVLFWGRRWVASVLEWLALRGAKQVWVIRPSLIPWVKRRGVELERIRVIPHGVALEEWSLPEEDVNTFRERHGLDGEKVVLFVGRLERVNYVDDALHIATIVLRHRQDVTFVFLGDGSQRHRLEVLSQELGISRKVQWKGFRPREEVRCWRGASDVQLCLMGGFSLLEAAASSCPVISYDVEWHHEVIRPGETGILVPEHDTAQAAAELLRLLDHHEEAQKLAHRALQVVQERYAWTLTSELRKAAYRQLMESV